MEEKEIKDRIFTTAEELFMIHGFAKVTMDEIASSLGISKKTLYKFFSGKENLVKELIKNRQCEIEDYINKIWLDKELDFVAKLKKMMDYLGKQSSKLRSPFFDDLRKTMPEIWNEVHDLKKIKGLQKATELFNLGVEHNVFRNDLGKEIIILIYTSAIENIMKPETLSQIPYTGSQAVETVFKVIFEGILTEEGRAKYVSYQTDENISKENISNENF
jgi:AcrR family transcriptional regulator